MIIDKNPIINSINRTFTVQNTIDITEEIVIYINGIINIYPGDIEDITDNVITIKEDIAIQLDWTDYFVVIYTSL